MNNIYWNKYTNLVFLKSQESLLSQYEAKTPQFFWLPISFYEEYKKNIESFTSSLRSFFDTTYITQIENFTGDSVILRSSSLYSEDSKEYFGAWLYNSIVLKKECSFDEFKNTVIKVYESLDNKLALNFREVNHIQNEKMWIIIQEYLNVDWDCSLYSKLEYKGFLNSIVKNTSKVMSISQNGWTIILGKNEVESLSIKECQDKHYNYEERHLNTGLLKLPLDTYKVWLLNYLELAKLCIELSKAYGAEVQIEYVISDRQIYIVQIRPFPQEWCIEETITFPTDKEEICSIPCAFPFKGKVLNSSFTDYPYKDRIKYEHSSHSTSLWSDSEIEGFITSLPDILFIDTYANADHWHLESLVAERGWIVINWHTLSREEREKFQSEKQVYVVSNGIYAKIYKVETFLPVSNERLSAFISYKLQKFLEWGQNEISIEDSFINWASCQFATEFKVYNLTRDDFYKSLLNYIKESNDYTLVYPDDEREGFVIIRKRNKKLR